MHRSYNLARCAIIAIALFSSTFLAIEIQPEAIAQPEKKIDDASLLIEGEPGFKTPETEREEVEIEKPKIAQGVEFYFNSMFYILLAGGIALVIAGIYSATRMKK
ncbi:MAG: hypothetical protein KIT34_08460 [Cyanobacteria bacterium TGS_CYA1]|nr:hypothetical protein [Cyanobacteria bacterium TGS_CYA1]